MSFTPFIMESTGFIHQEGTRLLKIVAKNVQQKFGKLMMKAFCIISLAAVYHVFYKKQDLWRLLQDPTLLIITPFIDQHIWKI
jgi:hypothetical protein